MVLLLVKNPTGANEVIRALRRLPGPQDFLIALNDRTADGEDVSWIWDIDFGGLPARSVVASGDRAEDLALRLKYAGLSLGVVRAIAPLRAALDAAVAGAGGKLHVLATYTAMLEIRGLLVAKGALENYWLR